MSSRGSVSRNGHVTTDEYEPKSNHEHVYDAVVLVGKKYAHGLPDYSHTPNRKYIKENSDGSFREMRIYGDKGQPLLEIDYHGEKPLTGSQSQKVLHYHTFTVKSTSDITRSKAKMLHRNSTIYKTYEKYLKEYGL